jgi:hypothetical protein
MAGKTRRLIPTALPPYAPRARTPSPDPWLDHDPSFVLRALSSPHRNPDSHHHDALTDSPESAIPTGAVTSFGVTNRNRGQ